MRPTITALVLLFCTATLGSAQRAVHRFERAVTFAPTVVDVRGAAGHGAPWLVESVGGIAGSLAGFGLVIASADRCEAEDLVCDLSHAGAAMAVGTAGSALGAYGLGRAFNTNPSGLGAAVGSIAGAFAGIGVWHLMKEELNAVHSDIGELLSYSITQGVVTMLGSRIGRALKD